MYTPLSQLRTGGAMRARIVFVALVLVTLSVPSYAQLSPSAKWATEFAAQYTVNANQTYRTASNQQLKMDVYYRRTATAPLPTVVYMHGGFWVAGAKETALGALMPWLEMGFNVVNVEYRLGVATDPSTLAPAAVDDCFCALRFVAALPANYNIDKSKIIVTGESAGGHLSLAMGIIPESAGLGRDCAGAAAPPAAAGGRGAPAAPAAPAAAPSLPPVPKIAAVVNWFGITDVPDVIDGTNKQAAAARWFGSMPLPSAMEIAKKVSPLKYVRAGLPPIITVTGDADRTVPYTDSV